MRYLIKKTKRKQSQDLRKNKIRQSVALLIEMEYQTVIIYFYNDKSFLFPTINNGQSDIFLQTFYSKAYFSHVVFQDERGCL